MHCLGFGRLKRESSWWVALRSIPPFLHGAAKVTLGWPGRSGFRLGFPLEFPPGPRAVDHWQKRGGGGMKTEYFGAFSKTAIVLVGLFFVVAWAFGDESESLKIDQQLHGVLSDQQMAWNRGDIRQFMEAYWHHESLTFSSGGKTTRGWQATLDRYKSKYPDRATMGTLSFEALETVRLDENAAMTLGNWKLDRENPVRGNFSLVWKKIDGQWKIVHDHSSLLADSGS